jgi:6-phosphogluconolactonase
MPPAPVRVASFAIAAMPPLVNARLFLVVAQGNATGDIQSFALDPATAALGHPASVAAGSSSSFIAFAPDGRRAYTAQNRSDRLTAWAIAPDTGAFERLGDAPVPPAPGGTGQVGPAYVSVDRSGRFVLVANYRGHNAVVFALAADGSLGPLVANVSAGQHAHCAIVSPDNRIVFVPNLGSDLVAQYRFDDRSGHLMPQDPPAITTAPGSGPRHLTFAPDGRRAYLLTELDASLYGYDYDAGRGTLAELWRVPTLPADYDGRRWGADLHVHPEGRTLYVSNRAHDSLTVFALDPAGGPPTVTQRIASGGQSPRNFTLDPAGRFLFAANQDSGNLVTFAIDAGTGRLTQIATQPVGDAPYCVRVLSLPAAAGA